VRRHGLLDNVHLDNQTENKTDSRDSQASSPGSYGTGIGLASNHAWETWYALAGNNAKTHRSLTLDEDTGDRSIHPYHHDRVTDSEASTGCGGDTMGRSQALHGLDDKRLSFSRLTFP
jgi:hypothetical protein